MKTDAEIFIQISELLQKNIPGNWVKACLQIELEDHSGRSACFYQPANETTFQHADIPSVVIILFKALNKYMMQRQSQPWNSATYILKPDGHFDIYFEYQDFLASNVLDRRKVWRQKFLQPAKPAGREDAVT